MFYEKRVIAEAPSTFFSYKKGSFANSADAFFNTGRGSKSDTAFKVGMAIFIEQMMHFFEKLFSIVYIGGVIASKAGRIDAGSSS